MSLPFCKRADQKKRECVCWGGEDVGRPRPSVRGVISLGTEKVQMSELC